MSVGIHAFGGYVPRLRLQRGVVVDANAWVRDLVTGVCANPDCDAVESQDDYPFSEMTATLNSHTADRLTYCRIHPRTMAWCSSTRVVARCRVALGNDSEATSPYSV